MTPEAMPQNTSRSASQRVLRAESIFSLTEPTEFISTVGAGHVIAAFIFLNIHTAVWASSTLLRGMLSISLQLFCHFLRRVNEKGKMMGASTCLTSWQGKYP
jgi:hypothetical protein